MQRSADFVYGLPINAPILVLFVDIYAAGTDINLDGNSHHLIAACGMNGFSISGSTLDQTARTLDSASIKICLDLDFPILLCSTKLAPSSTSSLKLLVF